MTLGPACIALALLERAKGTIASICVTFGRVPMFYYLLHLPLIHLFANLFVMIQFGNDPNFKMMRFSPGNPPPGYPLYVVYLVWFGIVALLYFPCRWFAGVKARHRDIEWLSYL